MERKNVHVEDRGQGVRLVTIDRPEALNALSREVLEDLEAVFTELGGDDAVRAVVLTGAGEKAFVAGADIGQMKEMGAREAKSYALLGQRVLARIERLGRPVVAAVNGFALGGGCELAMACHIRIAAETARFGQPEVKLGVTAGFGGTQRLPRIVGRGPALEILLGGEMIEAADAHRIGLVTRVVEAGSVVEEALALAAELVARGPLALRWTLEAVLEGEGRSLEEGLAHEANLFGLCFSTRDQEEGMAAFLEKRAAEFEGR